MRPKDPVTRIAGHAALVAVSAMMLAPFYWMVATSLKSDPAALAFPPQWFPWPPLPRNYVEAFRFIPFLAYLRNTLLICLGNVVGTALSCSLVAYGLACIPWKGRSVLFFLIISTMMLPGLVTMIPVFMIFKSLGWIGTFRPLIVPGFFGSAFFIFLLRQFFMTLPTSLLDSARVDGCGELRIYAWIILPLSKPALITVAFLTFTAHWNDFMTPLIYLTHEWQYTLSVGLQHFVGQHEAHWPLLMAAATIMSAPVIVLFFLVQKKLIGGITLTGVKG